MKLPFFTKEFKYTYPLNPSDAVTDGPLLNSIPTERRYRIGPFYCDTSPQSHIGPFKYAIDFVVPDDSVVLAVRSGIVVDVVEHHVKYGPNKTFASLLNYLTIDHGDQTFSQYAHLKAGSVSEHGLAVGKSVVPGQAIAIVGKTGWVEYGAVGDHLHFMVFKEVGNSFTSLPVTFNND